MSNAPDWKRIETPEGPKLTMSLPKSRKRPKRPKRLITSQLANAWTPDKRQRLALEMPQARKNFRDPRFRKVQMVGPHDYERPGRGMVQSIQFATALSVQRDSPPQWYLHCSFWYAPLDFQWPVGQWPEYFYDHVRAASMVLIPQAHARERVFRDTYEKSIIYRVKLEPWETMLLPTEESVEAFQ